MFARIHRHPLSHVFLFTALLCATALGARASRDRDPATSTAIAPERPPTVPGQRPRIDAVFVLDTTGSMSGLIEGAKRKIWSIASAMADGQPSPDIRIGLVGYRDRGDDYVTRVHDLDGDIDAVYQHLQAFAAGGGGDTPESVNQALHEAVTRMSWGQGADVYKVVFVVGDAPPHMDYQDDVPFTASVALARSRGIWVNTIQCGDLAETTQVWQQIARLGSGQYAAVGQDGGMTAEATPMDEELARLNRELADTVVAYGDAGEVAAVERALVASTAAAPSVAASRLAYLAKKGGRALSGRRDLVDAVKEGVVSADAVEDAKLPAEMQAMDADARRSYVQGKLERREEIQARIARVSREREAHLRAEREKRRADGEREGFDDRVLETVRQQADAAGIDFE